MFKGFLQIMIAIQMISRISGIMQLQWPKASTDFTNADTYYSVDCFTELGPEHLNKPLFVNFSSFRAQRPCLIRIPTQIELIFSTSSIHKGSTLRVISGNSRTAQHLATPQLKFHKKPTNDLTSPIYVGCKYATIVFKPYNHEDHLFFLMKEARPEFIESEDSSKCEKDDPFTTPSPSKTRNKRRISRFWRTRIMT